MTAGELLSYLRSLDINVSAQHGQLLLDGPKGALTPALRQAIAEQKPDVIALLEKNTTAAVPQELRPAPRHEDLPLAFAQERLWFLEQLEPGSTAYNIPAGYRLQGPLNIAALEQAFSEIVRRHEVLRTVISLVEGQPVQVVLPATAFPLRSIECSHFGGMEREDNARRLADEEAKRPFDLSRGPLLRVTLLRFGQEDHLLLVVMHHIVSDGWSMGILFRELSVLYDAYSNAKPAPLGEPAIQYADYAVWQRNWLQGEVLDTQLSYWRKQLAGVSKLQLPTDRPRLPFQTYRGARQSLALGKDLSQRLKEFSRKESVTLFMTLLAAFQALLHRYTAQDDVVVGSPIANRTRVEIEQLIGFFVNTLVLRCNLSGDPSFKELLARVRDMALGAYAHQDVPFEKLVEELKPERSLSHPPLFRVMFVLQNAPTTNLSSEGLSVSPLRIGAETAKFDLTVSMREQGDEILSSFEYATDLFDEATIVRIMGHFRVLVEGIVANPERRISELPVLTEAERHQLLVEWNDTKGDYPKEKCVHQLFEEQVERTPGALAIVFPLASSAPGEGQQLTYGELNRKANQLAHYLRKLGVGPDRLVGICMDRSVEMVIGILGTLKAGGAYVPLDPAYPKERLAFMLEDSQPRVLLTQRRVVAELSEDRRSQEEDRASRSSILDSRVHVVCLDTDCEDIARHSEENLFSEVKPENLAYVIYTSGSTGRPKGVLISHGSLVNHCRCIQKHYQLDSTDRVLQFSSLNFDTSLEQILSTLITGAKLVLRGTEMWAPTDFHKKILDFGLTVVNLPTAYWQQLAREWVNAPLLVPDHQLKVVIVGGDTMSPEALHLWEQTPMHSVRLLNAYGPTETTITASTFEIPPGFCRGTPRTRIPIGRPLAGRAIYILDTSANLVPIGVPGELYIGGVGLARGYLRRPELTAEKFVPNPFSEEPGARLYRTGDRACYLPDGNIEFLGRIDRQVKIRGFRIELGEIESRINQHPAVQESVAIVREDTPGDKRLVAYIVTHQGAAPSIHDLRRHLRQRLPDYMVPASFVFLDALPLTPNGKLDRHGLPEPKQARPDLEQTYVAPRNPTEEMLVRVWAELLGLKRIGIHDNFFDLGGHSLLAVRLLAEIEKEFKKHLPLSSLLQHPTIRHLANLIDQPISSNGSSSLVAIRSDGSKLPFFCVHEFFGDVLCYMNLARHLGQDQPFYALQARGLDGIEEPFTDIKTMAAYYIEEIQTVQPKGPYALGGLCFGGLVAFEMAQQLRAKREAVAMVALLDSRATNRANGQITGSWSFLHNLLRDLPSWLIGSMQLNRSQWLNLIKLKIGMAKARRSSDGGSYQDYVSKLIKEMGDLFHFSEQHRKVARAQSRALREYGPRVYPGRLTLFRARMQPLFSSHDPEKGWGHLAAGGVDIKVVPGNHLGMLQEPHVRVLAEELRACLDKAQTGDVVAESKHQTPPWCRKPATLLRDEHE